MSADLKDVQRLLDAFEHSDWESVHLRVGDLEVAISVHADSPPAAGAVAAPPQGATPPVVRRGTGVAAPASAAVPAAAPADPTANAPATPAAAEVAGTAILAPSPGIFWRSPAPGEPPFVDVGHEVDTDTTVCIVELMKLMNNVHAGVTGVVTAVLVGNGESVTVGQPLVTVLETPAEMLDAQ